MGLIEDIALKLERLESIPDNLITATQKAQQEIFRELLRLMNGLDVKEGNLVISQANLAKTAEIVATLERFIFLGTYGDSVKVFSTEFSTQRALNDSIFETFEGFDAKKEFELNWKTGQKNAIRLLAKDQVAAQLLEPINNALTSAVTIGQDFVGVVQELTKVVNGIDPDGNLLRHVKRVASDSFAIADRSYTEVVIADLGIDFFRYQGGIIKDSRQFCIDRVGKIFHIKEVMGWGLIPAQWQGRSTITNESNIFTLLGGFNCKHSLIPVDVTQVDETTLERVRAKGFI